MEDELLVLLEDRLGIGALRINPELQHAPGAGERAGDPAVALDLAGIADVDDDNVAALGDLDRISGAQGLDLGIGLVDQGLDAAVDGLGHLLSLFATRFLARHSGALAKQANPESRAAYDDFEIPDQPALRAVRNDERVDGACGQRYRTNSFIAPSNPSMVIGNMRFAKMRRMMVVDSE